MGEAVVLDGRKVAESVRQRLTQRIAARREAGARVPGLVVIRVGDDPASEVYVNNKRRAAAAVGMAAREIHLAADTPEAEVVATVQALNQDPAVDGILVQLPLPAGISSEAVLEVLDPAKDADGLTADNLGRLAAGKPRLVPCTPRGILELLDQYAIPLRGRRAVVVGRSRLVGMPMALLLVQRDATVTIVHSRTPDAQAIAREADVLVVAAGRRGLVGPEWVKPGAAVVDVGIHRTAEGIEGDVDFAAVRTCAGWLTPVPGGVGPLTVAMLLANTWTAYAAREGLAASEAAI